MKNKLGGKIMIKLVGLRPKTYSYLIDDDTEDNKAERTKKCIMKRILKFENYKKCSQNNEIILKSQQRFKCEAHNMYDEEINNIVISSNNYKILQTFDRITSYPYVQALENYVKQNC